MSTFTPGSLVTARDREWVVLPESAPDMLVLRPLGGADDDIAAVFPALEEVSGAQFPPPDAGDLGDARAAGLLRAALRIGFRASAGPFRSLASIAVEPRAYQLVPLMMALRQQTVRLLIADDVGIGKTIEAGLIATELLAQGSAHKLAVLCSPALAEQWQTELRAKFGIDAELVLASTVARLERGLDLGQSIFDKHQHVVVSTDFIKSTTHRDDFLKHCPDLVIVDEAHTCVTADDSGIRQSRQTQLRHELLRRVAENTERHLLLVTATPHNGKESAFRALLGLTNPKLSTVDLESTAGRALLAQHFVQRKRADVRQFLTEDGIDPTLREGTTFPSDRLFTDVTYRLSPAYRELLDDAITYASERVSVAGEQGRREARIAWWSAIALLRSLVSSPRAAAQTLQTRSATAAAATVEEADQLGAPITHDLADADGEAMEGVDVAPGAETGAQQRNRLAELAERARALEGDEDRKLSTLVKHVKDLLKEGYHPIIFCRYIPTAEYVAEHLAEKFRKAVVRAVTGTLSPQQRLQRIEDLAAQAGDDANRVLVATDCLSEGVNLQHYFDAVIHYDLAWNPTRHDQREGRVDRYGQKTTNVKVITLYGKDNGIDGKVLEVLITKHRQIRKDLGISVSVPDSASTAVTDAIMEWLILRDQRTEQPALFEIDERAEQLEAEWRSAADKEKTSRSRFAQRSIHPEEVATEVAAIRDVLGRTDDIRDFVESALPALDAVLRKEDGDTDFTVEFGGTPVGLRDVLAPVLGGDVIEQNKPVPFRATAAVARGEVAMVRTDPAVAALAGYLLNTALEGSQTVPDDRSASFATDTADTQPRPARRCGVIRSTKVTTRTTLLLVRYRFQLTLPTRGESRELVAEDARMLAFRGAPDNATWLSTEDTQALLELTPDANTDRGFGERTMRRVLDGIDAVQPHLADYGEHLAEELATAHRRVRGASGEIVRGLRVTPAKDSADILGAYVYLPVGGA